ncbi:unnamed protein product [Sphagnum troendelagicum]
MKSYEQKINAREIDGAPPAGRLSQPTPNASGGHGLQGGDLKSEVSDDPALNQNAHWVQRASWKSLVGADGRASFSLISSVTGDRREPEKGSQKQKAVTQTNNGGGGAATEPEVSKLQTTQKASLKDLERHRDRAMGRRNKRPRRSSEFAEEGVEGIVIAGTTVPEEKKKMRPDGSSFMRSATAEEDWRASRSELRMDSKAKHKAAVRTIKKLWGPGRSGSQK